MRRLLDQLDLALNPLMVKEVQQSLRNRAVIAMAGIVLGVPLLRTLGLIGSTLGDQAGLAFFMPMSTLLGFVCGILIPLRAAQQYLGEVKSRTIDLTLLSGLSAWRLASGRLQSAALQVLVMIALTAPFGVASIEFGGIGADAVLTALGSMLVTGVWQCSACLLAVTATVVAPKLSPLLTMAVIAHVLGGSGLVAGLGAGFLESDLAWWGLTFMLALLGSTTLLNVRLAADLLTPRGKRSYAGSKLMLLALLVLGFAPMLLVPGFPFRIAPRETSYRFVVVSLGVLPFCLLCAAFCASERRRSPIRAIGFLLDDGCVPTLAYACGVLLLLSAVLHACGWPFEHALLLGGYLVFFVGLAELLRSFFGGAPEAFYLAFVGVSVTNLLAQIGISIYRASSAADGAIGVDVFLPGIYLSSPSVASYGSTPWSLAPFAVGVLALCLRRRARPELAAHG